MAKKVDDEKTGARSKVIHRKDPREMQQFVRERGIAIRMIEPLRSGS